MTAEPLDALAADLADGAFALARTRIDLAFRLVAPLADCGDLLQTLDGLFGEDGQATNQ
ncbi:MAG: hypothetical protein M3336_09385 [Chloroflexota bacterium]|nr:hypothetical protein [Chloroflexota bacterium]